MKPSQSNTIKLENKEKESLSIKLAETTGVTSIPRIVKSHSRNRILKIQPKNNSKRNINDESGLQKTFRKGILEEIIKKCQLIP